MPKDQKDASGVDIYRLLLEASKRREREKKTRLLQSLGVKEFFEEGSIRIDMKICKGVECKLCIKACPTNALYWKAGEVGIQEELCVYCTACVWSCVVDNCIQVTRRRTKDRNESFSNPKEVLRLLNNVNSRKTMDRLKSRFPDLETYLKRHSRRFNLGK
ncbi:MAG: hypothetical protein QW231_04865 [Candidatus Bathyarchaeia archaeon]